MVDSGDDTPAAFRGRLAVALNGLDTWELKQHWFHVEHSPGIDPMNGDDSNFGQEGVLLLDRPAVNGGIGMSNLMEDKHRIVCISSLQQRDEFFAVDSADLEIISFG